MWDLRETDRLACEAGSDLTSGLTQQEAAARLVRDGPNELKEGKKKTLLRRFLEQLNDPLIYVLLASAAISFLLRETADACIIMAVVLLNAFVGLIQEGKAQRALESLKKLAQPQARVIREGQELTVLSNTLVKGDLVCLEAGMQVPADLRLVWTQELFTEESSLTGEAMPVLKSVVFSEQKALGDQKHMAFMSSQVTGGRGRGLVVATGMETQIGKIACMIEESESDPTPLQKRLEELGKFLSLLSLGICVLLFVIALFQKRPLFQMLLAAISLAVAAVPEGLPAVVTLCLAMSVTKMVKVNTIVRKLPGVETLGAVSVVCSDKTGTLTQNRMTVLQTYFDGKKHAVEDLGEEECGMLIKGMVLCCDAVAKEDIRIGDPTELALLDLGNKYGFDRAKLEQKLPRIDEKAFDSQRKMMSTRHDEKGRLITYTKGAPDVIVSRCTLIWQNGRALPISEVGRQQILDTASEMSGQALRTLALAYKIDETGPIQEENMTFLGLVGMMDPIRPEAKEAVEVMKLAGVKTVMITGDHVDTALAIARQLRIAEEKEQCMTGAQLERLTEEELALALEKVRVFARVSPADKVKIVRAFQKNGHIVSMTGDGVNDAPSLKAADVGVAMGLNGTDVARGAADLILTDDNFVTIQRAMQEGRSVYENIRKSVLFLLSSNLGEILTMFIAVLFTLPAPLRSSHILWINLITDSLPALALGVDKNDEAMLMKRPPRKADESLFANGGWGCTCFYGCLIAGLSLAAYCLVPLSILHARGQTVSLAHLSELLGMEAVLARAQTYAFTVLGISQLFHAIGMRNMEKSFFSMNHLENRLMICAFGVGVLLQLLVTKLPFMVNAFGTVRLSAKEWGLLLGLAAVPLLAHEMLVLFQDKKCALTVHKKRAHPS